MSLITDTRNGRTPDDIKAVADREGRSIDYVRDAVAKGKIVIPKNKFRDIKPIGIGEGLTTKVNANLGTSKDKEDIAFELAKLHAALQAKTDTVMDLSTGGDLTDIRSAILKECNVPLGTVPIYETAVNMNERGIPMIEMTVDDIFNTIESQARMGVDFVTVHCGVTKKIVEILLKGDRLIEVVSRGGAFLVEWIHYNQQENPLYEYYDRLLELAMEYELTLSLGDGLRPGTILDATDKPQLHELLILGELVERARKVGVQAMVEGPGHIPVNEVALNVELQKSITKGAPFYVLGPIVTDIAPGYDHITSAIGGAIAGAAGADFLCYVTKAEHLCLPDVESVREGVIVSRIAAHAADLAKGIATAWEWDRKMSEARHNLNWEEMFKLAIDPQLARQIRDKMPPTEEKVCTMCGEFCALKKIGEIKS